ncbi:hypothetical protein SO802_003414 [Lithocarpus litseifolius]|uniref:RNase H type-1 domain-containing protein n=1 Tax=Lithocarpus litseifolius TaxID=425828 RepID=A0AAW2E435_9ROSI
MNIINEKKQELGEKQCLDSVDLLSRFLSSGHSDNNFVFDIVFSFILAGDNTSAALTWFFWLLSKNPEIESEILKEIYEKSEAPIYDEMKDMVYTHASLCESMRLYPPVPIGTKEAVNDDVLPGRTVVKKGMRVSYFPYAMGRLEMLWGSDWAEFKPERWLQTEEENSNSKSCIIIMEGSTDLQASIDNIDARLRECSLVFSHTEARMSTHSNVRWAPPPIITIKLNVDATVSLSNTALAVVATNEHGAVLKLAKGELWSNIPVESDSKNSIDAILDNTGCPLWTISALVSNVCFLAKSFVLCLFCWVKRNGKAAAHEAA